MIEGWISCVFKNSTLSYISSNLVPVTTNVKLEKLYMITKIQINHFTQYSTSHRYFQYLGT